MEVAGSMRVGSRVRFFFAMVAATFAVSAAPALAAPTVSNFTVDAGGNPANAGATGNGADVTISMDIGGTTGSDNNDVDDLTLHLPPGLIANPQAAPKCTVAQLNADSCPAASQVGEVSNDVLVSDLVPLTASGALYNLVAQPGEPGRFGIVLNAVGGLQKIILQSGAALRPSDYGLDSILTNLPNAPGGLPISITGLQLTLYGKAGKSHNQGNFVRLPTSCGTNTVGVDITNKGGQTGSGSTTFDTGNCNALPFSPELSAKIGGPDHTAANTLPPVETSIKQTIDEAGLQRAQVALPKGMGGNIGYLIPDNYCSSAQFAADASQCPPSSVVGNARAASPLLADPLTGPLILIDNPNPTPEDFLPNLGLDLTGSLHLKITGKLGFITVGPDSLTGVTFEGLPDIPIADFNLAFTQDRLNQLARDACKPPAFVLDAQFESFSGATLHDRPTATIQGCGSNPPHGGKKPKAKLKLSHAGSNRPGVLLRLTAGKSKIRAVKLALPSKLKPASTSKLRKHSKASADGKRLSAKKISKKGRSVAVKLGTAKKAKLALRPGSLKAKHPAKPGSKLKFKVMITDVAGKKTTLKKAVKVGR
jgi:hypothetical protein